METLKIVAGEEETAAVVRALNDETRRRILHALRAARMTTNEICEFLKLGGNGCPKPQTIRYHLKELERAGLITWDGLEPTGNGESHIMTKAWRATAENVFIATSDMDDIPERTVSGLDDTLDLVGVMDNLGFAFDDEDEIKDIAEDFVERDRLWKKAKREVKEILDSVSAMDPGVYLALRRFLCLARLSDSDFERYQKLSRDLTNRFRRAYKDGLSKNPEVP